MYETDPDPHSQNAHYHNAEETSISGAEHYPHLQEQRKQGYLAMSQGIIEHSNRNETSMTIPAPTAAKAPRTPSEALEEQSVPNKSGKKGPRTWSASAGAGPPRRRSHGSSETLPPTFSVEAQLSPVSPSSATGVMSLSNLLLPNETPVSYGQIKSAIATDDDTEEEKEYVGSEIMTNSSTKKATKAKKPAKARLPKSNDKEDAMGAPPSKRRKRENDFPSEFIAVLENVPESAIPDNLLEDTGAFETGKGPTKGKGSAVKRPKKKNADATAVRKRGTPSAGSKRMNGPSSARGKKSTENVRTIYDSHSSNSDDSEHSSRSQFRRNGSGVRKSTKLNNEAIYSPSDSGEEHTGELNIHEDVLNYIEHVRQRNHRVLEEYEAQCQLKRDRLQKKFLARYERQVAAAKARQEEARRKAEEERRRLEELEAQRLADEQEAAEEAEAFAAAEAAELAKEKRRRRKRRRSKLEPGQDLETVRMQEEEARRAYGLAVEERAKKIWSSICRKHIPKVAKLVSQSTASRLTNCRRIAQVCQREQRKLNSKTTKATRDMPIRARRVTREMLIFWKKNEKEERELRKKAEKEALERARVEEEMREARRQARKLNFLITQTELYSHFVGKKIGTEEAMKPGPGDTFTAPEAMQLTPTIHELHDDLDITGDGDAPEMSGEIDFDDDDEVKLRQRARQAAQNALMLQQQRTRTFDAGARERRAEAAAATAATANAQSTSSFDIDDMNFQEPSMPSNHAEVHQPKMLTCTLKGYQLKGLNWLANLYEQGINGILADEMGLGKTVQSISLMAYLAETHDIWGPFLVIAPASTLHNWQQEISRFTPHLRALPYWGNVKDRKILRRFWSKKQLYSKDAPFHVLITSYQLVVSDEKYFQRVKWQYMVLDEAQAIKSSTSARWKTLLGFNCRNRLLLTGTPIQNTMQELWALLHFIMPSLFDSHEEFSEWFSKDIEAASENKGTLNEHQLRRLHMILKPFMLRRVKKHVQNELGDKIELEVYCDLTARQRSLYRGLKEKISISELLEKASADDGSVDSLMNLVMQFRKVCNHPELFERADVLTPFTMCEWGKTSSMAREGDFLRVPYSSRATLRVVVPKMLYRAGGILEVPNEDTNYLERLKCVGERFGVWTPDYIRRAMFGEENGVVDGVREAKGAFSFLRFVDSSPQETSTAFFGPFMRRVADLIQVRRRTGRRQFYTWVNTDDVEESPNRQSTGNAFSLFNIIQTSPRSNPLGVAIVSNALRVMSSVVEDMAAHHPLRKMLPAYMPKVIAPPPDIVCADRAFTVKHEDYLFDCEARAALNGISTLLPQHARSPLSGNATALLLEETHGEPLLSETFIDQGYSHVWVPALSKLVLDSGKLARLDSLLSELKAGGHRVLIYFQMTRMIDLMEEYLTYRQYTYLRLDGSSKISERRDMVGDWQTRPDLFVFLLSTRAGGLGINLTAADTVVFYDSDWNPTVDQQAMDRAHRLGQTKQVTVYRLITKGTIEERILQRAKQKDEIQKVVMTGTGTAEGFKQQVDFNKPREIVSLLLDDEELEDKLRRQAEKRKIEEEAKANNKKKKSNAGGAGTPTKAGKPKRSAPGPVRTLEDMWHEDEPAFQMDEETEVGSQKRTSTGGPPKKKSRKNSATTESSKDGGAAPKKSRPNSARSSSGKFVKKSASTASVSASMTAGSVAPSSSTFASPAPNNT